MSLRTTLSRLINPAPIHPWGGSPEEWSPRGGFEPSPELFHEPSPEPHRRPQEGDVYTDMIKPVDADEAVGDEARFPPAPLSVYREWLSKYLARGGRPQRFRDRPFVVAGVQYAVRDFRTMERFGANSRDILIPLGVRHLGGGLGHTTLFDMRTGKAARDRDRSPSVVLYNDPELLELPGMRAFAAQEREKAQAQRLEREQMRHARDAVHVWRRRGGGFSSLEGL